ncbi:acyltransferase family protein [Pedobacter frigoris]|uniref:Acyltransferase n=1 Tax=Pedobacter frigoris TaxID=2571272 RepID=A0A4U1CAG5_9SPHI|nr:acyltransferase [Pedobacter frigoris]TKC02908.1 acyltransferase [Pedobacter frigoris]
MELVEKKEKKNFDFVDTIRCISMIGIVFEHCAAGGTGLYRSSFFDTVVETSVIQSFKFSTIAFFLIGGFLINHKFQEYTAGQYLKNRFRSTIKPWLFWLLIYVALMVLDRYVAYLRGGDDVLATNFFGYVWDRFVFGIFYTSSWFVLNFLICICILLLFKRYLYSWGLGVSLALLSLIYSLNIYHQWFLSTHSTALFGFVFYLWLGVMLNRYFEVVMSSIRKTSWFVLISVVVLLFALAIAESFALVQMESKDAYNTLRITNVLYSFGMFALLLKIGALDFLQRNFEPRKTTFGIYLVHFVVVVRLLPLIFQPLKLDLEAYSVWQNTGIHILRFFIVYGVSFLMVRLIQKTRFKWIIGN